MGVCKSSQVALSTDSVTCGHLRVAQLARLAHVLRAPVRPHSNVVSEGQRCSEGMSAGTCPCERRPSLRPSATAYDIDSQSL